MTVDYAALCKENREEYGRAIGRIGKMLLEDRYDKRTHFIYEILQNAEDALRRRPGWVGSRAVKFTLSANELRICHFGAPFNEADVRGVCGINASTKDITSIGRFGIGFKSVYAFTRQPEVHSGSEAFSIVEYVLPQAIPARERDADETLIVLPLDADDPSAFDEIAEGLRSLGGEALLFLKHVDEIVWSVEGHGAGSYRRDAVGAGLMREVTLFTTNDSETGHEEYLLFSRDVENEEKVVGQAELAFHVVHQDGHRVVQPVSDARLVVFFPTVLPTYTGFLVQGPYQTTPSRDNVPADKPWNAKLAGITADLLVDALTHLQSIDALTVAALRTLPLDRSRLESGLFSPLYERTVAALRTKRLLPTSTGKFASAAELRLARAQDVRDLFGPRQLQTLLGSESLVYWASPEITTDRAPQLRNFLMQELKVAELTLDQMLARLHDAFLEDQSDTWMVRFYKLLGSQPALMRGRARDISLYRLENGSHVPLIKNGIRQVFLPTREKTGFPTLRASLHTSQTRKFLESAGLTEPDPVDDVILNLLPGYKKEKIDLTNYAEDIARMLRAFDTDSWAQRDKLIGALKSANIVVAKEAANGKQFICKPGQVYLAAARMTNLFEGVKGVYLLDTSFECLRGEKVRDMLDAAGATRILRTESFACDLTESERMAARRAAGWEGASTEQRIQDADVAGLAGVLELLPTLTTEERRDRARLLWEAVAELVDRRGASVTSVAYNWTYMQTRSTSVDAKFLRRLNQTTWIPDQAGELRRPSEILFAELGFPPHPVLETRIAFKPPAIATLAREVGIDADVLDELKRLGVTDLQQLRDRLREEPANDKEAGNDVNDVNDQYRGGDEASESGGKSGTGGDTSGQGEGNGSREQGGGGSGGGASPGEGGGSGRGTREFISYVGTRPEGDHTDPDGITRQERMDLEEAAIALILRLEPTLERTPAGNEGFDLIEKDVAGEPERWIEVKAMKGTLADRPVGLSSAQMEHARRCGDQFWLYVVERAGTAQARVLKICNPHGATGTFTFDRGWEAIASIVPEELAAAAE
ncbi:sacsin N-terminal ATP-binding-like domain-containing protein [Ensifer adhaerens]|uniref:sacsin N-terminal ATP-binding-like domain-containing protein n=1 Tax=Ensifer adhaerens TaxID=106592 RepID=UPI000DC5B085|nr:DUF3883 domain-containing protein [Ensifer adhaerens]RAS04892.1 uncharacterized protein DUF3883 [Ensifer adhaerens]